MKTKFFAIVAFMLFFVGTGAMAQSVSTEISDELVSRADVNGDGTVDEADIAEIIAIMQAANGVAKPTKYYWYVGQDSADTLITTDNYKEYCQSVTNYQSTQTFTVNDKYLYLVVLADKTVEAIDTAGGPLNFKYLRGEDNVYIPVANDATLITLEDGKIYRIYRSAATANDKYTITIN
mgnify:CR=1 FL=1